MPPNSTFWIINSWSSIAEVLPFCAPVWLRSRARSSLRWHSVWFAVGAGARSGPIELVHSLFAPLRLERAEFLDYVPLLGHRRLASELGTWFFTISLRTWCDPRQETAFVGFKTLGVDPTISISSHLFRPLLQLIGWHGHCSGSAEYGAT